MKEHDSSASALRYVESAYFGEDLFRALRFAYPTKLFDQCYFEIDEQGTATVSKFDSSFKRFIDGRTFSTDSNGVAQP